MPTHKTSEISSKYRFENYGSSFTIFTWGSQTTVFWDNVCPDSDEIFDYFDTVTDYCKGWASLREDNFPQEIYAEAVEWAFKSKIEQYLISNQKSE